MVSSAERVVTDDVKKGLTLLSSLDPGLFGGTAMTVFNGAAPNTRAALALDMEEVKWWSLAGAKGLTLLTARERG